MFRNVSFLEHDNIRECKVISFILGERFSKEEKISAFEGSH
jgi:hypothetical protein